MQGLIDDRSLCERWVSAWRSPHSITAILSAIPGDEALLHATIKEREADILADLAKDDQLHAMRIVVLSRSAEAGSRILINSVSDAVYITHLEAIAEVVQKHLAPILSESMDLASDLARKIQRNRIRDNTLFLASIGLTVSTIREEARLREVLRGWLDDARRGNRIDRMTLDDARRDAAAYVSRLNDPGCAIGPVPLARGRWLRRTEFVATFLFFPLIGVLGKDIMLAIGRIKKPTLRFATYLLAGLWWLYAGLFTIIAIIGIRVFELFERDIAPQQASAEKLSRLEEVEERRTKNELTEWFPVRKSLPGRLMMRLILFGAERGARHCWTDGRLAGAQNIHFARLVMVDRGRTMVFMSDYEGSFDAYMNHFIGIGGHSRAVIPISSRVWGSPKTRWLYWPKDPIAYPRLWKDFARRNQLPAAVRYVAYSTLSANDIINNSILRKGLFADHTDANDLEEWVRRI